MSDPPFVIALRLDARIASNAELPLGGVESLPPVATLEASSPFFAPDELPPTSEAEDVLRKTFADHPLVNTSRTPGEDPRPLTPPEVFVTAQVVVQADLAPILPGSEFPNVDDDLLTGLILVHRAPATGDPLWEEDEGSAGHALLRQIATVLPLEFWHLSG
jgi:hypothetical protein